MNKLNLLAVSLMMFGACGEPSKQSEEKVVNDTIKVGADKDDHGCKGSAGYTWSKMKNDCIQIFNEGFRLNPVETEKNREVVSAFILMSEDQTEVELFLPDSKHQSILLSKAGNLLYKNDSYAYDAKKSLLYAEGKLVYKGNVE